MFKPFVNCFLILNFIFLQYSVFAADKDIYCYDSYDEYRQIKYWAKKHVSVSDYNYKSGDAKYLNLTYAIPDKIAGEETNKEIVAHFDKEFGRLIKGNLPYHDTSEGREKRFNELYSKFSKSDNFFEIVQAQEEARRTSLYGPNPGAIYCIIKIERHEFPVLYEMECNIVANKDLRNYRDGIGEKKLGYSTPEHISGELKQSLTKQLEELSSTMKKIRNCK
jgi:hypothetical protein